MKLGEALNQRKYLTGHIPKLTAALAAAVTVVAGAAPDPAADTAPTLKQALDQAMWDLIVLIVRINNTNNQTRLSIEENPGPPTIMEGIARREFLKMAVEQYGVFFPKIKAHTVRDRYNPTDPPVSMVVAEGIDAVAIKAQLNLFSKELRELDTALQAANWTVDLIEE